MNALFFRLMILLLIPSVILCSFDVPIMNIPHTLVNTDSIDDLNERLFSYDDVLRLLEEIEEGDLEKRCTTAQLEKINQFLAHLARAGLLPDVSEEELEKEVKEKKD